MVKSVLKNMVKRKYQVISQEVHKMLNLASRFAGIWFPGLQGSGFWPQVAWMDSLHPMTT
jgi:hypothetical protein